MTEEQMLRAQKIRQAIDGAIVSLSENPDGVIRLMYMVKEWAPGSFAMGDVRKYNNNLYKCVQAHDSTQNPAWNPSATPALWANYHGTSKDTALPWVAPTGAHDMYKAGEYMIYTDGVIYKAKMDTAYSPTDYAQAWEAQS